MGFSAREENSLESALRKSDAAAGETDKPLLPKGPPRIEDGQERSACSEEVITARDETRSVNPFDGLRCGSRAGGASCARVTIEAALRLPLLRMPRRAIRCWCSRKDFAVVDIDNI
jgi:hypothetical protein